MWAHFNIDGNRLFGLLFHARTETKANRDRGVSAVMRNVLFLMPNGYSLSTEDLSVDYSDGKAAQLLPDTIGKGHSIFIGLEQGLNFIETDYSMRRDMSLLSRMEGAEAHLVVTLGLQGNSRFCPRSGEAVDFREGYTTITCFGSSLGARRYRGGDTVHQLRFSLDRDFLLRYFDDRSVDSLFNHTCLKILSHRPISSFAHSAAQQLVEVETLAKMRRMFLQGQALTILAAELAPLFEGDSSKSGKQHYQDALIAQKAKAILEREFRQPPTVAELARRVGTNQLKLKQLFHDFHNNTPYGVLLEIRMKTAYRMLESKPCHIAVVADFVGYRHASNFSSAFQRFFGISPRRVGRPVR